jgi:hypothetical protein
MTAPGICGICGRPLAAFYVYPAVAAASCMCAPLPENLDQWTFVPGAKVPVESDLRREVSSCSLRYCRHHQATATLPHVLTWSPAAGMASL